MSMFGRFAGRGFVTAFGPTLSDEVGVDASASEENGPGAVQSYRDECDINNIMGDVERSGAAQWLATREGTFEDVTGVDFQSAMDTIVRAQEAFEDLPSNVRDRFANDPARFLDFVHDEKNRAEMVALGLAREPVVPPVVPPSVPPSPEKPKA